jgi:hypothetical protein
LPLPVLAQDANIPEEWEERFAELEERVSAIELRLDEMLAGEAAPAEQEPDEQAQAVRVVSFTSLAGEPP